MTKIWLTAGIVIATMVILLLRRRADGLMKEDEAGFYRLRLISHIGPEWLLLYIALLGTWLHSGHASVISCIIAVCLFLFWARIGEWFAKSPKTSIDRPFVEYDEDFTLKIQFSTPPRRPFTVKIGALKYHFERPERLIFVQTRIPSASAVHRWHYLLCVSVNGWWFRLPLIDKRTGKKEVKLRVAGVAASHDS